jgi:hypothetical protein
MLLLKSLLFLLFALIWCACSAAKDQLSSFKVDTNAPKNSSNYCESEFVLLHAFSHIPACVTLLIAGLLVLTSGFELVTGVELYHPLRDLSFSGAWGFTGSLFTFGAMIAGVLAGLWLMGSFSPLGGLVLAIYAFAFWYFGGWEMMSSVPPWSWFAWIPG